MSSYSDPRVTFIFAERDGRTADGKQWRTSFEVSPLAAIIGAAALKPYGGIGKVDGLVDFVVVFDGAGAWGAGRLLKTFPDTHNGITTHKALVDPTDVHPDVAALVDTAFKPKSANGAVIRQSIRGVVSDGVFTPSAS